MRWRSHPPSRHPSSHCRFTGSMHSTTVAGGQRRPEVMDQWCSRVMDGWSWHHVERGRRWRRVLTRQRWLEVHDHMCRPVVCSRSGMDSRSQLLSESTAPRPDSELIREVNTGEVYIGEHSSIGADAAITADAGLRFSPTGGGAAITFPLQLALRSRLTLARCARTQVMAPRSQFHCRWRSDHD